MANGTASEHQNRKREMIPSFENPEYLWGLLLVPLLLLRYIFRGRKEGAALSFPISGTTSAKDLVSRTAFFPFALRMLAISCLVVAIARPRNTESGVHTRSAVGIDIVLAIDLSGSMEAMDFKPNRLEAAKEVAMQFVQDRPGDRFGVVAYAGESFTQCPLTTDQRIVLSALKDLKFGMLQDGTAIGMGLATAVSRLKDSEAKSKVIILMSDGVNNSGEIDPTTAAEIAAQYNIRTYTIGVGTQGMAPFPMRYPNGMKQIMQVPVEIDEEMLSNIAAMTNAQYFRATNNEKLKAIYDEIDKMEKTKVQEINYYRYEELFRPWVLAAMMLLALEFLLRKTLYKSAV